MPTLIVVTGLLLMTSIGMAGLWADARTEVRKTAAVAQTVAAAADSTIRDLGEQVADLQARLDTASGAGLELARSLRGQLRTTQRRYRTAKGCIDDINAQYNSATYLYEIPRHMGAALNGANCSALGYYFG